MATDKSSVFEKANGLGSVRPRFGGKYRIGSARPTSPRPAGVVLKSVDHPMRLGLLLVVLAGSLLGQVAASGQTNRGLPGATGAISPAPPLAPSGYKPGDDTFVIGNDDVLAVNVWKEPDFSRSIQVRSDGKISLPLLGEVQAAGRTPLQLEQDKAPNHRGYNTKQAIKVMV